MKIVLTHGYSDSNKGDLAIVVATVNEIRRQIPDCDLVLQSVYSEDDPSFGFHHRFMSDLLSKRIEPMMIPSPYVDEGRHTVWRNLRAFGRLFRDTLATRLALICPPMGRIFPVQGRALQTIKSADVVILKGGQYIYNDQGGLRGYLYLWRMLHCIHVAKSLRKKVIVLGQSIGPLNDVRARQLASDALNKCNLLVVRETLSQNLLKEIGVIAPVALAPDMAFLIEPEPALEKVRSSSVVEWIKSGDYLAVTVVNWSYPGVADVGAARARYESAIVNAVANIAKNHLLNVLLLPQVTVKHHGESDVDVLERIKRRLLDIGVAVEIFDEDLSPSEFSYMYGNARFLLGTRLHSCILAACAGTPVIAIRYQGYKTEGVMAGLGLSEYVLDINDVSDVDIEKCIEKILASRAEIVSRITARVGEYRVQLQQIVERSLSH